ncbi:hypothetical protein OAK75_04980 [Bacteriovoracales bacterium]|nr:hypothetical protein [Bacteriovoracales bacterium]
MERQDIVNEINKTFIDTFEIESEKLKGSTLIFQDLDLDGLNATYWD